jgi:hypothetical protein
MAKIKLRRDLAATWTSQNPTLAAGEPGFETDTRKIKYGDGTTAWTSLSYAPGFFTIGTEGTASGDGGIAYNISTAVLTYTPPDLSTLIELTDISVGAEAVASNDGGIAYNNTTGVFTYTPPTALGIGAIALSSLSVGAEAAASGDGGIAFNSGTGVFTYTPPLNITGNAATATTLATARTIAISGDVTGTATSFNGSADITISSAITADSIVNADINTSAGIVDTKLATISTAGKVSNSATTATELNTASAIVARDASGNFVAGTITAALSGNASTATTLTSLTASITELNYNDITTLGTVEASKTVTADASSIVLFLDNAKASFGTGSDLQIYHDGTHSYINDAGTGNLKLAASQIDLLGGTDGAETMATFVDDGAVTLYHDNAIKIATTSTGVNVTGSLIVNGSEDLADAGAASLALNASYFTTAAAETATLAAGTEGQIKTFMMDGYVGNMVITVTNPGWGGAGTITFSAVGQGCILQYVNSKWFSIGNNGAAFA